MTTAAPMSRATVLTSTLLRLRRWHDDAAATAVNLIDVEVSFDSQPGHGVS
jgi:hypothetical protein